MEARSLAVLLEAPLLVRVQSGAMPLLQPREQASPQSRHQIRISALILDLTQVKVGQPWTRESLPSCVSVPEVEVGAGVCANSWPFSKSCSTRARASSLAFAASISASFFSASSLSFCRLMSFFWPTALALAALQDKRRKTRTQIGVHAFLAEQMALVARQRFPRAIQAK